MDLGYRFVQPSLTGLRVLGRRNPRNSRRRYEMILSLRSLEFDELWS